jgi:hypothetical protein
VYPKITLFLVKILCEALAMTIFEQWGPRFYARLLLKRAGRAQICLFNVVANVSPSDGDVDCLFMAIVDCLQSLSFSRFPLVSTYKTGAVHRYELIESILEDDCDY